MKANDPCFCGSGKLYKKCHKALHITPPARYLDAARKFYVGRWVVNAAALERGGDYAWMLDQLTGPITRVLDIGVGDATGLVALMRRFSPERVVALEENPECIRRARTRLAGAGYSIAEIERMAVTPVEHGGKEYDLSFTSGPIVLSSDATIVVTDPLFDHDLATDLAAAGPFDLVIVWLMGSHEAREHSRDVMALGHMTAARYRLFVQNAVYELADRVLAVGGRLQVVDRFQSQDEVVLLPELRKAHAEQTEPTTLEVTDVALRPYREARSGGVRMLLRDDGQGTPVEHQHDGLLASVVSTKR